MKPRTIKKEQLKDNQIRNEVIIMIIGVDHGYGCIKTLNHIFTTGITEYEKEPYTMQNVIKYNGKYYVCGSGRQSLVRDKTQNDSYYILTLAAIAKEMTSRNAGTKANIILAAGLPLTSFGRDKDKFTKYLKRSSFQPVKFEFEEQEFKITITDVMMYPQGYLAVIDYLEKLKSEPSVIVCDVGSWTVDVMRLDNGRPNAATCRSLELGIIRMIDEILEQIRRSTGLSVTAAQVEQVLKNQPCSLNEKVNEIIIEQGKAYVNKLFHTLLESGFDAAAVPIIFLGGGASLVKQSIGKNRISKVSFIEDIRANAIGYERITSRKLGESK